MTSPMFAMTSCLPTLLLPLFLLLHSLPHQGQGAIIMKVSPYPARVYERAPAGVAILTVRAYDNETGQPLTSFRLEKRGLSEYFSINSSGVMYTARSIDRILGFVFRFFVFAVGSETNSVEWKHVMVEVSKKNQHPPLFNRSSLTPFVYRRSPPGTPITTLQATDADPLPYNRRFSFSFPPHPFQPHARFVNLTSSGEVTLARAPPEAVRELRVTVRAVDEGSPSLTGTASLVVVVDDVKQPDTFCLSSSHSHTSLCWKNPMPHTLSPWGTQYTYQVVIEGPGRREEQEVAGERGWRELCVTTSGLEEGEEYSARVTVSTNLTASTPALQLSFSRLGPGFSMDCVDAGFSPCNFLQPCQNGASCEEGGGLNYTCHCQPGWQGHNCTHVDLCAIVPCQNGGRCVYTGHEQYLCDCTPLYTGSLCQVFNVCAADHPCQHDASCRVDHNGTYHCTCPDYFTGSDCSVPDPCRPSPCGQGGQCVQTPEGRAECRCYPGYFGERCGEVDLCQSDRPCQHGGTCLTTGNSTVTCVCPQEYTGPFCEAFNSCTMACQNNATCTLSPEYWYICACLPGYHGDECQHYDGCHSNPCLHNGSCVVEEGEWEGKGGGGVTCHCLPGYWGELCQHYNACLTDPCEGRGHCVHLAADRGEDGDPPYRCQCHDSWRGPACQHPDPCHIGVCHSGATCQHQPPHHFRCVCSEGQYGDLCQHRDPCLPSPCPPSTSCVNLTSSDFLCVCPPAFSGSECQYGPVRCDPDPCPLGSRCLDAGVNLSVCVCLHGGQPPHCTPACPQETLSSQLTGRSTWPLTVVGAEAEVTCRFGGKAGRGDMARRRCLHDNHSGGAVWGLVDESDCTQLTPHEASRRLQQLRVATSDPAILGSTEVSRVTSALEDLYGFTLMDTDAAAVMLEVISNLCDVNTSVMERSNKENNSSDRLLALMDKYSAEVTLSHSMEVTLTSRNIELRALLVHHTSSRVRYVPSVRLTTGHTVQMDVSITIPPEAFRPALRRVQGMTSGPEVTSASEGTSEAQTTPAPPVTSGPEVTSTQPVTSEPDMASAPPVTSDPEVTRLQLQGHRKGQLFIPGGSWYSEQWVRRQAVVSCTVTGRPVVSLTSPVVISIRNPQPKSNVTCVFWNTRKRQWSTEGVVTVTKGGNWSVCHSFHLTSFALLLDPSPDDPRVDTAADTALTYISFIGSALSLLALTTTLLTYALFRSLTKERSGRVLLQLCLALALLHLLFLLNGLALADPATGHTQSSPGGCRAVGVLLHFSLLASLCWMLVEALDMYRALVQVLAAPATRFWLKTALLGWGVPMVIVGVTVAVDTDNYSTNRGYCFVSSSRPAVYYGSVVAPACGVLVVNSVLFVRVTRVLLTPRFQQHRPSTPALTPTQVRGAFTVMVLLGVTWVFGPLAIREAKLAFNFLFCILNSLQGLLIFVFRCVFNPEVRRCWVHLLKTGRLKRRPGPLHSRLISDTSSRADFRSGASPHGAPHGAGGVVKGACSVRSTLKHTQSNGCAHKVTASSGGVGTPHKVTASSGGGGTPHKVTASGGGTPHKVTAASGGGTPHKVTASSGGGTPGPHKVTTSFTGCGHEIAGSKDGRRTQSQNQPTLSLTGSHLQEKHPSNEEHQPADGGTHTETDQRDSSIPQARGRGGGGKKEEEEAGREKAADPSCPVTPSHRSAQEAADSITEITAANQREESGHVEPGHVGRSADCAAGRREGWSGVESEAGELTAF